ncbi:hypothetical protein ACQ4WX_41640 [Streptomyces lasalocidi]
MIPQRIVLASAVGLVSAFLLAACGSSDHDASGTNAGCRRRRPGLVGSRGLRTDRLRTRGRRTTPAAGTWPRPPC